jgi:hypothetical protein
VATLLVTLWSHGQKLGVDPILRACNILILLRKLAHPTGFEPVTFAFGGHYNVVSFGFKVSKLVYINQYIKNEIGKFSFFRCCSVSVSVVSGWYPDLTAAFRVF